MTDKPGSLIFDMDGTLWDALDTYVLSWNTTLKNAGFDLSVDRPLMESMMGWEKAKVIKRMFGHLDAATQDNLFEQISATQNLLIPSKGGTLYPGVFEGLELLSKHYKLFIVSNCPENTIKQFMKFCNIEKFITDQITHGLNGMPKHYNIKLIMNKYQLKKPYYVGDTDSDRIESSLAAIPFVYVTYGFGNTEKYHLKFDSFTELTIYFLTLLTDQ